MHVDELAHAVSVVFCRSALSDFDLTPGSMHVEEDEQVGRCIALILAVETFELAWSGRDRLQHLADELCRTLVETDHRALRIGLFSIEVEHVLHAGDILGVDLRNAPHVLRGEFGALGLAQFNPIAYIHPCLLCIRGTDEQLNRMADVSRAAKSFTPKQGQYLAFIHLYTRPHRRPPAEAAMQEYFRVSPPSVHQMVLTLERAGFIRRKPRVARSIEMLVDPKCL